MAFAAAALPFLQYGGMALSAMGAFNSSQASQDAYNAQSQIAKNNAVIAGWQAEDAITRGDQAATASRVKTARLKGSQRAALAANGVDLSVGSAQHVLNDTDYLGALDANRLIDNAAREAWGYRTQASNFEGNANILKGRADAESPWMAAGTSLLTSAGKVASTWYTKGAS